MPPTLLIRNATCIATMDEARTEWRNASVFVCGHLIEAVGPAADLPQQADTMIDAHGHLVVRGLVNTHHHMYQSPTRAMPACTTRSAPCGCAPTRHRPGASSTAAP